LYPEGTRNKTDMPLQPFYDGAFICAIKAQKPIIPALIFNTKKIMPNDKIAWLRPSFIYFDFLEPIPTAGLTIADTAMLKEKVRNIMEAYYVSHLKQYT
jgi:1-acyl-sn-glycerol-3-phosphate acyltransferase